MENDAFPGSSPVQTLGRKAPQEQNYIPGFTDRDDPAVTVSFVAFPLETLEALFCPYHDPNSRLVKQQRLLHGAR